VRLSSYRTAPLYIYISARQNHGLPRIRFLHFIGSFYKLFSYLNNISCNVNILMLDCSPPPTAFHVTLEIQGPTAKTVRRRMLSTGQDKFGIITIALYYIVLRSSIRSPRNETTGEYSRYFIAKFPWSYKLALTSTINAELRHFVSTRVDFAPSDSSFFFLGSGQMIGDDVCQGVTHPRGRPPQFPYFFCSRVTHFSALVFAALRNSGAIWRLLLTVSVAVNRCNEIQ